MRFIRVWPQAWQAKQALCQKHRSPALAANTPHSPGFSSFLHCQAGWAGQHLNGLSSSYGSSSTTPNLTVLILCPSPPARLQTPKPGFHSSLTFTKSDPETISQQNSPRSLLQKGESKGLRKGKAQGWNRETYSLPSHRCVLQAWEAAVGPPPVPGIPASAGHRRVEVGPAPPPLGPDSSAPAKTGPHAP